MRSRPALALCVASAACSGSAAVAPPAPLHLEPVAIPAAEPGERGALPDSVRVSELSPTPSWSPSATPAPYATTVGAFASLTTVEDEITSLERAGWAPYYRRRVPTMPGLSFDAFTVDGPLDKVIVRRYVRRNTMKLLYCYERRLLAIPGLAGTIVARFRIMPDGTVVAADAIGLDLEVAKCVRDVLGAIEFPKPRGTEVAVVQTMTFRPAGR